VTANGVILSLRFICGLRDREFVDFDDFGPQDAARMDRVLHPHVFAAAVMFS
jgi:hypothetical protein